LALQTGRNRTTVVPPTPSATTAYPILLSPLKIGPKTLRNRVVVSGHSMHHSDGGLIGDRARGYMAARARGGTAMVTLESALITPGTRANVQQISLYDDAIVPGLGRLADAVHDAGGLVSIILWHGGHNVPHHVSGRAALAPSAIPSPSTGEMPRAMTKRDFKEIRGEFRQSARRCREAGLDAVEVQTATDYLLGSFLSPRLNLRTDEYGGQLENRIRFVAEVLQDVREVVGSGMAVGLRTSANHVIAGDPDDYGLRDSLAAMQELAERGLVDWVSVMNGSHYSFPECIPPMSYPRLNQAALGKAFKDVLDVPVFLTSRIRTPAEAESLLANGETDVVAMARTLIAEPEWANKAAAGQPDRIRPCLSCNQGCLAFSVRSIPASCIVNPVAGREFELDPIVPAATRKRIAVVGGGPAGLETARVLALRGHTVSLHEAAAQLGGALRLAGGAPFRGEMLAIIDWWERELRHLGVTVYLDTRVDPARLPEVDEVVWAIGATVGHTAVHRRRPYLRDGIPGSQGLPHGRQVMAGETKVAGRIFIVGEEGEWPLVSLIDHLLAQPGTQHVTVAIPNARLGEPLLDMTAESADVMTRLANAPVRILRETLVEKIEGHKVTTLDGTVLGPFDAIVLSTGTTSRPWPEAALGVGDCVAPRGIWAATHDANRLARSL
jgi:2,4-dienoyl-CoA reductase-like NADH-dependent reductase (Old Yellow Enzyme family)